MDLKEVCKHDSLQFIAFTLHSCFEKSSQLYFSSRPQYLLKQYTENLSKICEFTELDNDDLICKKIDRFLTDLGIDIKKPETIIVDLFKADVTDIKANNINLKNANFHGTNWFKVKLFNADCSGTDISGADLFMSNFYHTNFENANFSGSVGSYTFSNCNMKNTNFQGAVSSQAHAITQNISQLYTYTFFRCDLSNADFGGADLRGARLIFCNLTGAKFDGANLDGVLCDPATKTFLENLAFEKYKFLLIENTNNPISILSKETKIKEIGSKISYMTNLKVADENTLQIFETIYKAEDKREN